MSADKDPEYLLGETKREVERLQKQHAWHKLCLGDKFVWAPVDLQKPGLKVLDVGCADGTLLRDLRQQVSASAQLVGVDVMSGFLPPTADGNISYAVGDVCEPPVPERSAVFDLALVRYTLAGAAAYGIDKAVANLVATVAPGGWLQIQEMWKVGQERNSPCSSFNDVQLIFRTLLDGIGVGDFSAGLEALFRSLGLENVKAEVLQLPMGKKLGDGEVARRSTEPFKLTIPALVSSVKGLGANLPESTFDRLAERWEEEMLAEGEVFEAVVVYGQKPATA